MAPDDSDGHQQTMTDGSPQVRPAGSLADGLVLGFGTKRPPCPLRARWAGRTQGFTVTDGAPEVHTDLRRGWSDPPVALIPKLTAQVRFPSPALI
jgi:hypothetical protein